MSQLDRPHRLGFEKFDAVGARRDKFALTTTDREDRGKKSTAWQLEIDSAGFVAGVAGSNFSSPAALGAVLAQSTQCQECIAKQYFRYISGRTETAADRPVIRKMTEDFRKSNFKFQELMLSLLLAREANEGNTHAVNHH